jgi:hypothetical protein
MSVEAVVSLGAAWTAHSPALLGFGGDSETFKIEKSGVSPIYSWKEICPTRAGLQTRREQAATSIG